jgi:glycerol uptake facilitator-like aquaporin
LAIGLTILAAAFAWWWISGWAFNPAVGLSSMIVWFFEGSQVSQWWLYLVGPMLGGVLAWGVYEVQKTDK